MINKIVSWFVLGVNKVIVKLLRTLNKVHLHIIEKYNDISSIENKDEYEVLLPNTEADKAKHYTNPFTVALKTPKVNNIAITGAYGSGKSSFLRTFEKENAEWNYLPISLATFKDTNEDIEKKEEPKDNTSSPSLDTKGKDKSELLQDIERSILQQFFYREKDSQIPYSRFKRIGNIQKKIIFYHSFVIGFLFLYGFSIFKTSKFEEFFSHNFFVNHEYNYLPYISVGILFYYLYRLFTYLWNIQISKFNFKKGEIAFASQDKASILNEHLDEILYFFEVTEYDVVLFEDIDRFDDTEIFIKLRELNNLINNSKQIDRRVRFVYAIRDDMFVDKERTKFFDFIVPIIPHINPSTSEVILLKKFEQEIIEKRVEESFISDVSLHIDDTRFLLNVYNEYMIYKNYLSTDNSKPNQILALVIYKNFYPLDFSKLYYRDGDIYTIFNNVPEYIQDTIEEYRKQKNQLMIELKELEEKVIKETIESIEELRFIYIGKIVSKHQSYYYEIGGTPYRAYELNSNDVFESLSAYSTIFYKGQHSGGSLFHISFKEIEEEVNHQSYRERVKTIESRYIEELNSLKKQIEKVKSQINELEHTSLEKLFDIHHLSDLKDILKDKKLLLFLVRNGYIDENYEDYISYFHNQETNISKNDREFLLSIQTYSSLDDFRFKLRNIKKLVEKLKDKNFKQTEAFNFNLTDFLLNDYSSKADIYFKKISDGSELSIKFIFAYLEFTINSSKKAFIKRLEWNNLWLYIYNNFSTDKENEYFILIFQTLDTDRIIELNVDDSLKKYLESHTSLPKYSDTQNEKCKTLIDELELEFSDIENPSDNEELFNYIYENWNYELSERMIQIMLDEKADINIGDLNEAHFSTIRRSGVEELISYIDTNIEEYVENIFLTIERNTKESEETVLYLLNNDEVSLENKVKIIQKEEVRISDINAIESKELWIELFKDNKIEASWDNILYFYQETEELSQEIIEYLNVEENYIALSNSKIDNEQFEELLLNGFKSKLLLCNTIEDEGYRYLIKSIEDTKYHNLDVAHLSQMKIDLLLAENKIVLVQNSIDNLKENFSPKHITLIENYKDEFLERFNEFEIAQEDLILLLNSSKFEISDKFFFIEKSDLSDIGDKLFVKEKISKFYIDNSKYIEDIELFNKLFYGDNKYDLELLISQIPYIDDCNSFKVYLDEFGDPYDKILENNRGYVSIDKTDTNELLLKVLREKDCIGKLVSKKNKINVYRKWSS
ncbi:MAG: Unknown protein [uncultured Sulfurovum sp.]|uniref:YobI-like P-loop NTPase domain-containing protein n=1 Tax=uncultured Sulfurovum sp. TaxID=269237 RepID=A0A6S6T4K5_9BACT|nr:MAG: Unknown protein [uncultured Sulfurovum sp.]